METAAALAEAQAWAICNGGAMRRAWGWKWAIDTHLRHQVDAGGLRATRPKALKPSMHPGAQGQMESPGGSTICRSWREACRQLEQKQPQCFPALPQGPTNP